MIDPAIIQQCADPSLKPAIVEKFIKAAGAPDPLAVTIRAGNRAVLVSPPKTPDEAMELIRRYLGQAMIRVGVTQYPAGFGLADAGELKPDLVEVCANIKMGTALFGKVYRIVVKWYGGPADQAFGDAVDAWKTGYFDGKYVFDQPDPGALPVQKGAPDDRNLPTQADDVQKPSSTADSAEQQAKQPDDPNKAGIRIDLTGIGVGKPK